MESLLAVVLLAVLLFGVLLSYKKRENITKWLNDPAMTSGANNREKMLRRRIEDAQEELDKLQEKKEPRD